MRAIRDPASVPAEIAPSLAAFMAARFEAMVEPGETYAPETHGWFLLIEPGDDPDDAAECHDCFALLTSPCGPERYGEPDFVTPFSWVTDHGAFFEGVIVLSDGGEFIAVLIPKADGIDDELLALCAEQAAHVPEPW